MVAILWGNQNCSLNSKIPNKNSESAEKITINSYSHLFICREGHSYNLVCNDSLAKLLAITEEVFV